MSCYVHNGQPWFGVVPPTCTCGRDVSLVEKYDFTGASCWPSAKRSHAALGLDRHDALDTAGLDEDELALLRGLIALMRGRKGKN
jgi:hypothetical protein